MTPNILPYFFFQAAVKTLQYVRHHQHEGVYHTGSSYNIHSNGILSKSPIEINSHKAFKLSVIFIQSSMHYENVWRLSELKPISAPQKTTTQFTATKQHKSACW